MGNFGKLILGESSMVKQIVWDILVNLLEGLQLFHCTYRYWQGICGESSPIRQICQIFLLQIFPMQYKYTSARFIRLFFILVKFIIYLPPTQPLSP